jgi:hypothetical protein
MGIKVKVLYWMITAETRSDVMMMSRRRMSQKTSLFLV